MLREHIQYAHSTDQLGFFRQNVTSLEAVVPKKFEKIRSVEVIGLRPIRSLKRFVDDVMRHGFQVSEIHGSIGEFGKHALLGGLSSKILEWFTPKTKDLLKYFPDQEILVHNPEAENPTVFENIIAAKPKFIWIENSPGGEKDFASAVRISRALQDHGVNTAVMFDVSHYIHDGTDRTLSEKWQNMIDSLYAYASNDTNIAGIHMCIGNSWDCLPLEQLTDSQLEELKLVLFRFPIRTIVYENQQKGISGLLGLHMNNTTQLRERSEGIYKRLSTIGLAPNE